MHTARQAQRSPAPFDVVFTAGEGAEFVLLQSVPTADEATIAFHQARERLTQNQVVGELLVVHRDGDTRTLLREPLGRLRAASRFRRPPVMPTVEDKVPHLPKRRR